MMQRRTSPESGYPNRGLLAAVSNDSLETLQHSTHDIYFFSSLKQCISKQDHPAPHSALKDIVIKCGQKKERTRGVVCFYINNCLFEHNWIFMAYCCLLFASYSRKGKTKLFLFNWFFKLIFFKIVILLFNYSSLPTTPPHPKQTHLPPLLPCSLGFVHVSFIVVPENPSPHYKVNLYCIFSITI